MSSPKEFHIDAVYPEHLSRLRRGTGLGIGASELPSSSSYRRAVKRQVHRAGGSGRFRTQPVTFHEIKEVDEDNLADTDPQEGPASTAGAGVASKSETDLKAKFELFYRSINSNNDTGGASGTSSMTSPTTKISMSTQALMSSSCSSPATTTTDGRDDCQCHPPRRSLTCEDTPPAPSTSTSPSVAISFNTKNRPSI